MSLVRGLAGPTVRLLPDGYNKKQFTTRALTLARCTPRNCKSRIGATENNLDRHVALKSHRLINTISTSEGPTTINSTSSTLETTCTASCASEIQQGQRKRRDEGRDNEAPGGGSTDSQTSASFFKTQHIQGEGTLEGTVAPSESDGANDEKMSMMTERLSSILVKAGYGLVGNHSAVKVCRWTKKQLRGCEKVPVHIINLLCCAPIKTPC